MPFNRLAAAGGAALAAVAGLCAPMAVGATGVTPVLGGSEAAGWKAGISPNCIPAGGTGIPPNLGVVPEIAQAII